MKTKKLGLMLLMACFAFFIACDDNKETTEPTPDDNATAVAGTYGSLLDINVPIPGIGQTFDNKDIIVTRTGDNKIKVELKDFSFMEILVGDVVIEDIKVNKNGNGYSLTEQSVEGVELGGGKITADIILNGVFEGDELDFNLTIKNATNVPGDITVKAKGLKDGQYSDDLAERIAGEYGSEIGVVIGEDAPIYTKSGITLEKTEEKSVATLKLKDFSFMGVPIENGITLTNVKVERTGKTYSLSSEAQDLNLSLGGAPIKAKVSIAKAVIEDNILNVELSITAGPLNIKVYIEGVKSNVTSHLANILAFEFESDLIESTTIGLNSTEIVVEVKKQITNAELEQLKDLSFTTIISEGATIDSEISTIDLTSTGTTELTVKAANGASKKYTVRRSDVEIVPESSFDMEEWVLDRDIDGVKLYSPGPSNYWGTSNHGSLMATAMAEMELTSAVVQSTKEDAYKGGSAAIIETLDTKGIPSIMPGVFPAVPKVTAGTLFSGIFEVDVKNTLNSTKFGVDFDKKPLSIKGYYKYTSGEKYYECADPSKSEIAIENSDLNNKDQFSISAYLYEYDPAQETKKKYSSYLTGVNIKTSDKVIAKKEFNGGNQLTYKEFTLPLEYTGKYEEGKNYRLAIVFSSSKDGDKFSGAPGSVLYVDDIEIVWE